MKLFIVVAALLAVCTGAAVQAPGPLPSDQAAGPSPADQAPHPGGQAPGPDEAATNKINGERQHKVNVAALYHGASAGTAPYYGVPGTSVNGVHNDGVHDYFGHAFYGHPRAYGYPAAGYRHGVFYGGYPAYGYHHGGYYGVAH